MSSKFSLLKGQLKWKIEAELTVLRCTFIDCIMLLDTLNSRHIWGDGEEGALPAGD